MQIITEAGYRLGDDAETVCPGPNWTQLRGLGNLVRHAYHSIQDELIWEVIKDDLPALRQNVQTALHKLGLGLLPAKLDEWPK